MYIRCRDRILGQPENGVLAITVGGYVLVRLLDHVIPPII